ncbi:His-Xaa-Ser system-associated MauG-like protein [Marinomonas sp.]|uniref:His-Xaa-Ser system-associated MauG-like protein n=1 Tax=Marinomonas sp. TaxID=1904862 RepID=UPI003A927298
MFNNIDSMSVKVPYLITVLFIGFLISTRTYALSIDDRLTRVIETFSLNPASCGQTNPQIQNDNLVALGRFLFNTTVLSGGKDTSCSTCHLDSKHLTDGLPVAVGVGGHGEGMARMASGGIIVPRNAFSLFNRSHPKYKTFFWDGKVIEQEGLIYSPIGEAASKGFNSAFSVAAVLPILARDEFLGEQQIYRSSRNLELVESVYFDEKFNAANKLINELLTFKSEEIKELNKLKSEAGIETLNLANIGNAITAFLAVKLNNECQVSQWDKYLAGNKQALTPVQKEGAILFFGKGRCAACHNGDLFTDMGFHSIGVPQGDFGTHIHGQDIGRAGITFEQKDRYKFRTPPLLGVSKTPPYGHNGSFQDLITTVRFHVNPIPFLAKNGWTSERELLTYGKILSSRSEILGYIDLESEQELEAIVSFLEGL